MNTKNDKHNKLLMYIKILGTPNYTDYVAYLDTLNTHQLITLRATLINRKENSEKLVFKSLFLMLTSTLPVIFGIWYKFAKNVFKTFSEVEANILVAKSAILFLLIAVFIILLLIFMVNYHSQAKIKKYYLDEYLKEKEDRKKFEVK